MLKENILFEKTWNEMLLIDQFTNTTYKIKNFNRELKRKISFTRNISFDTETYKGSCKLLANNNSDYAINPSFKTCLDFLFSNEKEKGVYRWFFNIDFDISAILKLWNKGLKQVERLKDGFSVKYKNYELFWLKGIMFKLKKNDKSIIFTDLYKFFETSLEKAVKNHINDKMNKNPIDAEKLNTSIQYWHSNTKNIIDYCVKDCILTNQLADKLLTTLLKAKIALPRYLCSFGSLAKSDFRTYCKIPNLREMPKSIIRIAYSTYYGGRFEQFKKGFFEKGFVYDITSEYPNHIQFLPNLNEGVWYKTDYISQKPKIAYYLVDLDIPEYILISTIPFKLENNMILHLVGKIKNKWLTWFDLDLMRDFITKFHVGFKFLPSKKFIDCKSNEMDFYYPFYNRINFHFKLKTLYKNNDITMYNAHKKVMNSIYGCNIERHLKKNSNISGVGVLFNPIYGSQITANGRWSLFKELKDNQLKHLIACHTDSLTSEIKIPQLKLGHELGNWNLENEGKVLQIATGIYQVGNKCAVRGIPKDLIIEKDDDGNNIRDWFSFCKEYQDKSKVEFKFKRMRKLSEGLIRDKNLEFVNTFQDTDKSIRVNSDLKRDWFKEPINFKELSTENFNSLHWFVNMDEKQHEITSKQLLRNGLLL